MKKIALLIFLPYIVQAMEPDSDASNSGGTGGLLQRCREFAEINKQLNRSSSDDLSGDYLLISQDQPVTDDTADSPTSGPQTPIRYISRRQNITTALETFRMMREEIDQNLFRFMFQQAIDDELNVRASLESSDRIEKVLGYLQKPAPLALLTLSTMSGPIVRSTRQSTRFFPLALLPSLSSPLVYGTGIAAAVTFYFAKNAYTGVKLWWRDCKIERLTAALETIDVVQKAQDELAQRIAALEQHDTIEMTNIQLLFQEQKTLQEYVNNFAVEAQAREAERQKNIDQVVAATNTGLIDSTTRISETKTALETLKLSNAEIAQKLTGAVTLTRRILNTLELHKQAVQKTATTSPESENKKKHWWQHS